MDISVILPTYCESGNIGRLIQAIGKNLESIPGKKEVIVVDDNSPDGTAEIVKLLPLIPGLIVRCIVRKNERGLASAIKCGIENSSGKNIVVMDTDFNHAPVYIPTMIAGLDSFDMLIGSRFIKGGGMHNKVRYWCSYLFNRFLQIILNVPIHDNLSGFFSIRRNALINTDLNFVFQGYGEYFIRLIFIMLKLGYRLNEIPVFYELRLSGQSKSSFFSMLLNYTRTAFKLLQYRIL